MEVVRNGQISGRPAHDDKDEGLLHMEFLIWGCSLEWMYLSLNPALSLILSLMLAELYICKI